MMNHPNSNWTLFAEGREILAVGTLRQVAKRLLDLGPEEPTSRFVEGEIEGNHLCIQVASLRKEFYIFSIFGSDPMPASAGPLVVELILAGGVQTRKVT